MYYSCTGAPVTRVINGYECHTGAGNSLSSERPKYLDEAKMDAFRPPKQDRATAMGMIQLNMPNVWSANVWRQSKEGTLNTEQSFVIFLLYL